MNRLERLLNLVAALLHADRPLSRADILERVPGYGSGESARRAFERDKEALRTMGIPLVVEPVAAAPGEAADGYRIPPERYRLPDPGLAPDELAALHLAVSTVRLGAGGEPASGRAATTAIWKLGGATAGPEPGSPVAELPGSEHLPVLFGALGERRPVRFAYRGEERVVDPYRLSFAAGRWYLLGRDHRRGAERNFRLDRLESAPQPGEPGRFEPPGRVDAGVPPPWRMGDEDEVEALLLVDATHAEWAVSRAGAGAVRDRRADGSVVLALGVTNREAFRSFVLGFLDHAEVLAPAELRADMVEWLAALAGGDDGRGAA